jgi:hypothetical protein
MPTLINPCLRVVKNYLALGENKVLYIGQGICYLRRMAKIDEALTITQAAAIKGITRQAMHYAIKVKKVKTMMALGQMGIHPDDLAQYKPNMNKVGRRKSPKGKRGKAGKANGRTVTATSGTVTRTG